MWNLDGVVCIVTRLQAKCLSCGRNYDRQMKTYSRHFIPKHIMANQICDFTCKLWGNTEQVWWQQTFNTHLIDRYLFCVQVRFVDNLHSHVTIISAAEC